MDRLRLELEYRPPYDWTAIVGYFVPRAIPGVEQVVGAAYRRSFELGGVRGILSATARDDRKLVVEVHAEDAPRDEIAARVRRMFDLDADIAAIHAHLERDRRLTRRLERYPGLRVVGGWDPFELAVRAILGQQVSVAAATRLAGRLVERCGTRLEPSPADDGGVSCLFPPPETLAEADLSAMGMPGARVRAISRLGAAVARDPGLLASTGDMTEDIRRLESLPGIGAWTANYVALRALRHYDAFPASDLGLLREMEVDGVRPSPKQLTEIAEKWRPYRGYAAMCLWMTSA